MIAQLYDHLIMMIINNKILFIKKSLYKKPKKFKREKQDNFKFK